MHHKALYNVCVPRVLYPFEVFGYAKHARTAQTSCAGSIYILYKRLHVRTNYTRTDEQMQQEKEVFELCTISGMQPGASVWQVNRRPVSCASRICWLGWCRAATRYTAPCYLNVSVCRSLGFTPTPVLLWRIKKPENLQPIRITCRMWNRSMPYLLCI